MSIYVIGIDPGINGGIVALNNGHVVDISPMPSDPRSLKDHFIYLGFPSVTLRDEVHIFLENVHSMPQDGVHSAFRFGQGLGWLEGVLAVLSSVEPVKVTPATWMEFHDLKRDKEMEEAKYDYKKRIKEMALKLIDAQHKPKITLKTCDAYLLAYYGHKGIKDGFKSKRNAEGKRTIRLEAKWEVVGKKDTAKEEVSTRKRARLVVIP